MRTKTAREIKITENLLNNKKISAKVGAPKDKLNPETVYVSISFWTEPTNLYEDIDRVSLRNVLKKEIKNIYKEVSENLLLENSIFNKPKDNFFIDNIPDNINYNDKRNYINFELYLHTCNIDSEEKFPLSQKEGEEKLFNEAVKVVNFFGDSEILQGKKGFFIFNKNR